MAELEQLGALREAIEQVDGELLELLRQRMQLAEAVARAKLSKATPLRDPPREEQVLERVRLRAAELQLDPPAVERLFRWIMEMSVSRQQAHVQRLASAALRVAYQGVEGAYSHLAAQQRYAGRPGGTLLFGYESSREAVEALRRGEVDVALLPIENTTAGSVDETYDLLAEGGLAMNAEVVSRVEHRLLVLPGARLEDVRRVLSHPQALRQCAAFLAGLPQVRTQAELDTAGAARKVREANDPSLAAIASASAAARFGLVALPEPLQGTRGDLTRYVEVALEASTCPPDVPCKTSVVVTLAHRPGALAELLGRLTRHGVNLTKLESRPIPEAAFQYRFYVDVEGHAASREVSAALEEIRPLTSELRLLGSYPRDLAGEPP